MAKNENMTWKCPKCGADVSGSQSRCPRCGNNQQDVNQEKRHNLAPKNSNKIT